MNASALGGHLSYMKWPRVLTLLMISFWGSPSSYGAADLVIDASLDGGVVHIGMHGHGLCLRFVELSESTSVVDLEKLVAACGSADHDSRPIEEVKALLLIPGFSVASYEGPYADAEWNPRPRELPRFLLEGRIDPAPVIPMTVTVSYSLVEAMHFFGYTDGSVPRIDLGATSVGMEGRFRLDIPNLLHDQFVTSEMPLVDLRLNAPERPLLGEARAWHKLSLQELYSQEGVLLTDVNRVWTRD